MGMFDYIRCEHPLPAPNTEGLEFQTKDTPAQWLDQYVIRADGTLWHELYETEDRSDPKAEGLSALIGAATRINQRWEQVCDFTGEICFYEYDDKERSWLEFSAYLVDGKVQQVNLLQDSRPAGVAVPQTPKEQ